MQEKAPSRNIIFCSLQTGGGMADHPATDPQECEVERVAWNKGKTQSTKQKGGPEATAGVEMRKVKTRKDSVA
jgi:hypothetical protein